MKKLIVDETVCMRCGMCAAMDEEHFEINDSTGLSEVKTQEHLETPELQNAIDSCPVGAIKIVFFILKKSLIASHFSLTILTNDFFLQK